MIYLTPGKTQSVWLSLRETQAYGSTSSFKFTLTNDITGSVKTFYPNDLQPDNKWSRFNIYVGTPENLPNTINLSPGMWSLKVEADNILLETGKVIVEETDKSWTTLARPAKNTPVLRR